MTNPAHTARRSAYADRLREFEEFAFGDGGAFQHRGRWREFFASRTGPPFRARMILEVGCADGALLSRIAAARPDVAFVGLDWKAKAVYDAAGRVDHLGLRNVALVRGRAQDLRRIFGEGEVDGCWVFHPDPCDRDVELQNRLIAPPFLRDLHHVLRDETSILARKTDHRDSYEAALAVATARTDFDVTFSSADYWNDSAALAHTSERAFAREVTTYEARFLKKRRPIYYLELRKK